MPRHRPGVPTPNFKSLRNQVSGDLGQLEVKLGDTWAQMLELKDKGGVPAAVCLKPDGSRVTVAIKRRQSHGGGMVEQLFRIKKEERAPRPVIQTGAPKLVLDGGLVLLELKTYDELKADHELLEQLVAEQVEQDMDRLLETVRVVRVDLTTSEEEKARVIEILMWMVNKGRAENAFYSNQNFGKRRGLKEVLLGDGWEKAYKLLKKERRI
jgi:hypothetical protein